MRATPFPDPSAISWRSYGRALVLLLLVVFAFMVWAISLGSTISRFATAIWDLRFLGLQNASGKGAQ